MLACTDDKYMKKFEFKECTKDSCLAIDSIRLSSVSIKNFLLMNSYCLDDKRNANDSLHTATEDDIVCMIMVRTLQDIGQYDSIYTL